MTASPRRTAPAPICDTILKADDGLVLDWIFDRQPVPGAPGLSAFMQPIADLWRELLLRAIFHLAEAQAVTLPLLWLYPRNLPALGEISHDTDLSEPQLALRLLEALDQAQIHSTWCVILPGYPPEVIAAIRAAGHELAMHYDSFSVDRPWGEANFRGQREALTEMFGGQAPISNKNHYLRWEGDSDLWNWCVRAGIQLDQTKGPSKTGGIAFTFGTCHPYFPVDPAGRLLDVLELPTLTQDMLLTSPMAALAPMLDGVLRRARRAASALPPGPHRQAGADRCVPGVGRGRPRRRAGVVDGRRDQRLGAGATAGPLASVRRRRVCAAHRRVGSARRDVALARLSRRARDAQRRRLRAADRRALGVPVPLGRAGC